MRTCKKRFVAGGVLILAFVGLASLLIGSRPSVSASVVGYTTNQVLGDTKPRFGGDTYVSALVAVTNTSQQTFRVYSYTLLYQTAQGWKQPVGDIPYELFNVTLFPSRGYTFAANVPTHTACKVEFVCWDGHTPNPIWNKLPYWLSRRVPWANPLRRATTEVIDLRGAPRNMTTNQPQSTAAPVGQSNDL
jgi:hypothetical protein